jgi:hypothetical protein
MNTPTDILVITNGKAVIVTADKWPEEPYFDEPPFVPFYKPYGMSDQEYSSEVSRHEQVRNEWEQQRERLIQDYERQKLEALSQGVVVEKDHNSIRLFDSLGLTEYDEKGLLITYNGTYPIDPSLWVVEKRWQVKNIEDGVFETVQEDTYKLALNYKTTFPDDATFETRQIATIKPKAENNRIQIVMDAIDKNKATALAPTRKLDDEKALIDRFYYGHVKPSWRKNEAQYYDSWDRLMPVVEKIQDYGYLVEINGNALANYCGIHNELAGWTDLHNSSKTKIESIYKSVVEFIKWHNSNHHNQ